MNESSGNVQLGEGKSKGARPKGGRYKSKFKGDDKFTSNGGVYSVRGEDFLDCGFEIGARVFGYPMDENLSVATVKDCFGHGAGPFGIHGGIKRVHIDAGLLAVIWERGIIFDQEALHHVDVRVGVKTHAVNRETFWRILLRELDDHRVFEAAWLAPGGPEGDERWFAFVGGENFLVAVEID